MSGLGGWEGWRGGAWGRRGGEGFSLSNHPLAAVQVPRLDMHAAILVRSSFLSFSARLCLTALPAPRSHLEYKRPGGRSSQRFGDMVRRRLWRRRAQRPAAPGGGGDSSAAGDACLDAAAGAVPAAGGGLRSAAADEASAELAGAAGAELAGARGPEARSALSAYEAEAKKRAIKAFMSLILDLLQVVERGQAFSQRVMCVWRGGASGRVGL